MRRTLLLLLACGALAGCGGSGAIEEEWPGPPPAGPGGTVAVTAFNAYLDGYEEYATSPEAVATEFLLLEDNRAESTSLVTTQDVAESTTPVTVIATRDGLLDDSVRSARYELRMRKLEHGWRLIQAFWSQRCQAGRGHQEFSAAPCV